MTHLELTSRIESGSPQVRELRQAIHTLLVAISHVNQLQMNMLIKGGVLLAIRYNSPRHTTDVDFSTSEKASSVDTEDFIRKLEEGLALAVEELDYSLDCRIQKYFLDPKREGATFPTLRVNIGYAYKGTKKHVRLQKKACPDKFELQYSFNEPNTEGPEALEIGVDENINAYSLVDLVGEKYRAILQQSSRNRSRRQDAYDIYWIITNGYLDDESIKPHILQSILTKSESRGITANRESLRDEDIIRRSKAEYETLQQEISGELPSFEKVFGPTVDYYEALPWQQAKAHQLSG